MIKIGKPSKSNYTIKGIFSDGVIEKEVIKEVNTITEFPSKKIAYIYLGKRNELTRCKLKDAIKQIISSNKRGWNVEPSTFSTKKLSTNLVVTHFVDFEYYLKEEIWNLKTGKNKHKPSKGIILINAAKYKKDFEKSEMLAKEIQFVRSLQATSPNILNSVKLANEFKKHLSKEKNLSIKILTKSEIIKNKMGLLLAVNSGSNYDARVVVIEYKGNPNSKEKQALIGKGITFDAGGYNIKIARHMIGMKYDMSAAAIIVGAMKAIAKSKAKKNVVAVLCLTDNMVSKTSTVPDSVVKSMNGMSVEINNTDAEGRLVLADGITYAIRKCKATSILDMSTLTGAIIIALGMTYAGIWATDEIQYCSIKNSSIAANEKIWRMPFNKEFLSYMKKSPVADLRNTDYTGNAGSSTAAMFLKEFTERLPYIHLDIAGTANQKGTPTAYLLKTIYEFITHGHFDNKKSKKNR